jgi:hypothetical protein
MQKLAGSARTSRADDRAFAIPNFLSERLRRHKKKVAQVEVHFGEAPKPARETRALPRLFAIQCSWGNEAAH